MLPRSVRSPNFLTSKRILKIRVRGHVIYDKFPTDWPHGWKYIAFGPDGKLYVPVGAPFNIGEPTEQYASLFRMNDDGTGFEKFARGIRNTVGFTWHPTTHELWFTDNGRDMWVMMFHSTS